MKVVLPDALHARPANLVVRLAAKQPAVVELWKGAAKADARKILDVLSLGAAKGDEIELRAAGEGAEAAIAAIAALIARNFDADLVPETGSAAVEGIALGRALVVAAPPEGERARGTVEEEAGRVRGAVAIALADVDALVTALPPHEAQLFEPEREILRALEREIVARVEAGASAEDAVRDATAEAAVDLVVDARARVLDALAGVRGAALDRALAQAGADDRVLVAELLTPSLVAALPARVRGIVAAHDEGSGGAGGAHTAHAAILARARGLPLAYVPSHVALAIADDDVVLVDTTDAGARVWVGPSEALVHDAMARRDAIARARADEEARAAREPIGVKVRLLVNVGSLVEHVPPGVDGIGLLRTELVFAGRSTAPGELEQQAALLAIARGARGGVVTARLFDAGGDKPLPWLPAGDDDARGIALLFAHPRVLEAQLRAICAAAKHAPVRALVPMTRDASDVERVRRAAPGVQVGAMIETPEAAERIDAIAAAADFVCIGTNDLAAYALGTARSGARYALEPAVLALVERIVDGAHARGRQVTVCGEIAADPRGARVLVGLGVDALSVAPGRVPVVRSALRGVTENDCREAARAALAAPPSEVP